MNVERWLDLETIATNRYVARCEANRFCRRRYRAGDRIRHLNADFAFFDAPARANGQTTKCMKNGVPSRRYVEMERNGVQIAPNSPAKERNSAPAMKLEQKAYAAAGQPFNLNSPRQLLKILFDKMGIPTKGLKKLPKAAFPNEAVLEQLAP